MNWLINFLLLFWCVLVCCPSELPAEVGGDLVHWHPESDQDESNASVDFVPGDYSVCAILCPGLSLQPQIQSE